MIYANFLSGTTPIIPKNFSIEFSPAQLIGINSITLEDYKKNGNRILYDSKISFGGKTSEDGSELMAFATGLRFTWIDHTTLVNNRAFINDACKGLVSEAIDETHFINSLIETKYQINGKIVTEDNLAEDIDLKNSVDSLYILYTAKNEYRRDTTLFNIKALREKYKNEVWNKLKFESAAAIKFNSADSLFSNSYYSKFELYNTIGSNIGKSGQWLIGLNYTNTRKDSIETIQNDNLSISYDTIRLNNSQLTLSTRIYAGTNKIKAYLEGAGKYENSDMLSIGINIGAEVNVSDGIWAMINVGNNWVKNIADNSQNRDWTNKWYWGFDFRFKIPEKMKL